MASIRERRSGVWAVRGYTGRDRTGKPTQVSRTVYGTKRDAQRAAAELTVKPARRNEAAYNEAVDCFMNSPEGTALFQPPGADGEVWLCAA